MKKKHIYIFLSILLLISISCLLANKIFENDIFYTLKLGEIIEKYGIDFKDHLSWIPNLSYTYPHWFFDVLLYKIYTKFDFDGIYLYTIMMYSILILLIFILNVKKQKKIKASLITSILICIFMSYFSSARAQSITYIIFLLEIYFIEKYLDKKNIFSIIMLFIFPIIIANVHIGTFYLYYILFIPYIIEYIFAVIVEKKKIKKLFSNNISIEKKDNIRTLLLLLPFIFLMGFISPLGINVYTYYIKASAGTSFNFISEYDPINIRMFPAFFGILTFYFISICLLKTKIKISNILIILGTGYMALTHNRHYALFLIATSFVFCEIINQIFEKYKLKKIAILITCFVIAIGIYQAKTNYDLQKNIEYMPYYEYPINATKYIKENLMKDSVRLFNDYNEGSYLAFNDIPVLIDSRAELYTPEFNKDKGIEYLFPRIMRIENHYEDFFNNYLITHILVHKMSPLNKQLSPLPNYKIVYEDDFYAIYIKDVLENNNI